MVWKRWRRSSMAPSRPAVFREQLPLVVLSVLACVAGIAVVVWALIAY